MNLVTLLNLGQTDADATFKRTRKPPSQKIGRRERIAGRPAFPPAAGRQEKPKSATSS